MSLLDEQGRSGSTDVSGAAGDENLHENLSPIRYHVDVTLVYYPGRTVSQRQYELFRRPPQGRQAMAKLTVFSELREKQKLHPTL
jgi:hypothetical protein